ncbi:IQ domain-containing protein E [Antennarius striatus]|uniref:IQ domain-containing protein E n=1 Tax=Antennarius striatus TaxID=241820 RepID=UPI0035B23D86
MSQEASDVQTDEDYEELVEDGFSFSADFLEKKSKGKRSSGKSPSLIGSPYLTSMNVNPRRVVVAAWRPPRSSLGDTRGDTTGEGGLAHLRSLSNGHECNVTPKLLQQTLSTRKHLHSESSGFAFTTGCYKDKEDMQEEIVHLKKTLQVQKTDNRQMKAKLRRLEEDNAKREKQIEELLDPTKGSEYTRSLVDKKKDGSVVVNGLKQRILKLEQQCREKENALSKLQRELRTTNLEELEITVETYLEEIQRLRILLDASEKSSRAESKCSQRQQRALSSTVQRLSENLKQLQQENAALRGELDTGPPAGGIKGYREWSKQRLLRRLLEVEKRLEDSRKHTHSAKSSSQSDRGTQTVPTEILRSTMATEAVVSVGTITEGWEEATHLRERLSRLEEERAELEETLRSKDDEIRKIKGERESERERWEAERGKEWEKHTHQHKQELDKLRAKIQTLKDRSKAARSELPSSSATPRQEKEEATAGEDREEGEERDAGRKETEEGDGGERSEREEKGRGKAAQVIQRNWRKHRNKDIVMLQSALRGHVLRRDLLKETQAVEAANLSDAGSSIGAELDAVAMTMIQSAFRGHLARCSPSAESSVSPVPPLIGNNLPKPVPRRSRSAHKGSTAGASPVHKEDEKQGEDGGPWLTSSAQPSRMTPTTEPTKLHDTADGAAAAVESDDSDDIIVSPSRPMRSREVLKL